MEIKDKTFEKLDKLAKFLEEKGLVIATREEIIEWRPGSEVPEGNLNTPLPEPTDESLEDFPIPAEFIIITLDGTIIAAKRKWNSDEEKWNWWQDLGRGREGSIEDDQVKYWIQLPPLPIDNLKEENHE